MSTSTGWIGVDLDGTLAHYDKWRGEEHIGEPVPKMLARVKKWLAEGQEVRIVTARVAPQSWFFNENDRIMHRRRNCSHIETWCMKHLGVTLPITHEKDFRMIQLWDDRCVQVVPNTGERVDGGE